MSRTTLDQNDIYELVTEREQVSPPRGRVRGYLAFAVVVALTGLAVSVAIGLLATVGRALTS